MNAKFQHVILNQSMKSTASHAVHLIFEGNQMNQQNYDKMKAHKLSGMAESYETLFANPFKK